MDDQWIRSLFSGLLSDETIHLVCDHYDEYKDVQLSQLGLESLSLMALVIRVEEESGREIDYESFDIADVSTLSRTGKLLGVD
jgi:acyl carrier protein